MKKVFPAPRWVYLVLAVLVSAEGVNGIRQTWLRFKYGDVLGVSTAELIGSGVLAVLFVLLAAACWYLWLNYYKRNDV